jgi:Ser/Thr protein kinase RdoA (MazF antagonist)
VLRRVRLVLCDREGGVLGMLPRFGVGTRWWPDVLPVIDEARRSFGVEVLVLRLLDVSTDGASMGGDVTYLAEVVGGTLPQLEPAGPDVLGPDDPLRAAWARPGGIEATLAWADERLADVGRTRLGPPIQEKTWNLSSILRLPVEGGEVWCKQVPPFMAQEGAAIAFVARDDPSLVPRVLARDVPGGTILMEEVPGEDQWEADEATLLALVERWIAIQHRTADRVGELADAGAPDWRSDRLAEDAAGLLRRDEVRSTLEPGELTELDRLAASLPARLAELDGCGLPPTIVHGDFHPGNWRADGVGGLVLLDWGDAGIGHPLFDATAFLQRLEEPVRGRVLAAWIAAWRRLLPDADPARAAGVIPPIAALRQALIYRAFLDGIEATERVYHEGDVPAWLRRAIVEAAAAPA